MAKSSIEAKDRKKRERAEDRRLREQRQHELVLATLDAFKADPELKYYLGVAGGAGMAVLGGLIAGAGSGSSTPGTLPPDTVKSVIPDWAFLISPGLMASPGALPNWMKWSSGDSGGSPGDIFGFMGGITTMMGTGFAGFCAGILILRAVFGEGGAAKLLESIIPG